MGTSKIPVKLILLSKLILVGGILPIFFQNCSPVKVESLHSGSTKVTPLSDDLIPDDRATPKNPGPAGETDQPPVARIPDESRDPREIDCQSMAASEVPEIAFDSKPSTGSAPVSIHGFAGGRTIEAETVTTVSNFAGDIKVLASSIGEIGSFAASSALFNAGRIGKVHGFAAGQVEVVTHELREAKNFAGDFCASAQNIGTISNLASRLSLYGRGEQGKRAQLGSLQNVAGFISIYDFDIGTTKPLSGAAISAKLVNSRLSKLQNAAVDIILVDSVIEEVSNVAGVIHLKGKSQILKRDTSAIQVITEP